MGGGPFHHNDIFDLHMCHLPAYNHKKVNLFWTVYGKYSTNFPSKCELRMRRCQLSFFSLHKQKLPPKHLSRWVTYYAEQEVLPWQRNGKRGIRWSSWLVVPRLWKQGRPIVSNTVHSSHSWGWISKQEWHNSDVYFNLYGVYWYHCKGGATNKTGYDKKEPRVFCVSVEKTWFQHTNWHLSPQMENPQ